MLDRARLASTPSTNLITTGDVSGGNTGIRVSTVGTTSSLLVAATNVTGSRDGIFALNFWRELNDAGRKLVYRQ